MNAPMKTKTTTSGPQPIESAPKDGTRILLHPAIEVADSWSKGYWSKDYKEWFVGGCAMGVQPTHWMPLPDAPGTPKNEAAADTEIELPPLPKGDVPHFGGVTGWEVKSHSHSARQMKSYAAQAVQMALRDAQPDSCDATMRALWEKHAAKTHGWPNNYTPPMNDKGNGPVFEVDWHESEYQIFRSGYLCALSMNN